MTRYTPENSQRVEQILLDGEPVVDVVEADTELGFVVQLVRDCRGYAKTPDGNVQQRLRVGSVAVILDSGMAAAS